MNLKCKSFLVVAAFVGILAACSKGGPQVAKTPAPVSPSTASNTNDPNYKVTMDDGVATQIGVSNTATCAQAIITNATGDSSYMNFYGGACPTANQIAAGSNAAFSLGIDNPSGDEETYFLYDDASNYVGEMTWTGSAFNITQLCTGSYSTTMVGPPAPGNDQCKITVSGKSWTGITNGAGGNSLSF